jgi:hypothetical protein
MARSEAKGCRARSLTAPGRVIGPALQGIFGSQ